VHQVNSLAGAFASRVQLSVRAPKLDPTERNEVPGKCGAFCCGNRGSYLARLNIEDSIYKGQEFQDLLISTGNRHTAKGMVWELFQTAQEFWFPDRKPIPKEKLDRLGLRPCVDCGLAEEKDGGVYVHGSEKAFGWLFAAQDAGNASAVARAEKRKSTVVQPRLTTVETGEPTSNVGQPLTLSSSSLLSSLPLSSFSDSSSKEVTPAKPSSPSSVPTWEAYRDAYQKKYGEAPVRNARINSQLKQLISRIGVDEAPFVAEFYLSHNDQFYGKKGHPVGLLLADCEKLRTEWKTNRKITAAAARGAEQSDHYQDQLRRIAAGEI
jgi:hypothetical protein